MGVWYDWGYGIVFFRALNFQISEPEIWQKPLFQRPEFQGFSWKFRPLKTIFRTLENGHSIRHQSIPPLSAGRALYPPLFGVSQNHVEGGGGKGRSWWGVSQVNAALSAVGGYTVANRG